MTAFFRILLYIFISILLTTPVAVLGDSMNEFVEKSFMNLFIMIGMLLAIVIAGKYIDKRPWSEFGITLLPGRFFLWAY